MGLMLTVLGASGSYAGPGQACSGYLVRSATTTLWVDAGSGTLANLQRHVGLADVDAVVLSHHHPDHCRDLEGYFVATRWYERRDTVPVYAPAGVRATLAYDGAPLEWHDVTDGDALRIGDVDVRFSRTDHTFETLAVRLESGGAALGYSADSGPGWSLAALGPGLDLALCEATLATEDEGKAQHMSPRQAAATARDAGADRLLLTHLVPGLDRTRALADAAAVFAGPVGVAVEHGTWWL